MMRHIKKLSVLFTGLFLTGLAFSAMAKDDAQLVASYENAKPTPGGLSPSTRGEYATCWMAWSRWGQIIIGAGGDITDLHADWSLQTADALFQHWWKKAEEAYGEERGAKLISKAQEMSDYFHDTTKTREILEWAGTCYVPETQRLTFKKARPLKKYLEAARIEPEVPAQSQQPQQPATPQPGTWQWVYGQARGTNFTCRDYYSQTEARARAAAKAVCREKGGVPDAYPEITNSGFDAYKANADRCYEAVARVRCDF